MNPPAAVGHSTPTSSYVRPSSKKASRQRGVCVNHLNRCKTSTLIDGIAFPYQVLCHEYFTRRLSNLLFICRGPQFKVCSTCRPSPSCAFFFCTSIIITVPSTRQPSPSQPVLVHSSLCNPPTGNPPLQSVRVCPTSASATTVHCVFHLPQSELVLSISIPVNENHLCSPHNRQPDRNQYL